MRLKAIAEALKTASLVIIIGWAGVVAIAYLSTIPARASLPRVESTLVTILALTLFVAWLASWRALAKSLIIRRYRTQGDSG